MFFRAHLVARWHTFTYPHMCAVNTFIMPVHLSEERAKDDVDVGPDADTWEEAEIEIQEEAEAEA